MKILYCFPEADNPNHYGYNNIRSSLIELGHSIVDFDFLGMKDRFGKEGMVSELNSLMDREKPDIFLHGIVTDELPVSFLDEVRDREDIRSVVFFSDDDWRIYNHSLSWVGHYNYATTNDINALAVYRQFGYRHVFPMQYAANPRIYYPRETAKRYDVTFVGQAYLGRPQVVEELLARGIDVRVWGSGWDRVPALASVAGPPLPTEEMIETFRASRIVLGMAWCSVTTDAGTIIPQIKGRTFEYPACGAFQITFEDRRLQHYFDMEKEIATFRDGKDLAEKIGYYLDHEREREEIARASHERVLREHTWKHRWDGFFPFMTEENMNIRRRRAWGTWGAPEAGKGAEKRGAGPLVSVVCFVYNRERYMAATIESVLGQTYSNIEFVILNDGSTDGTEAVIKRYLHDPRLKYHYQENIGQTMDRFDELNNRVVALSSGEYICAIGADDVYLPGRVERQLGEFLKNPGLDVSFCNAQIFNDAGQLLPTQFRHERALTFNRFNLLRWLFTVNFIAHPSVMIRRSSLIEQGGYETGFATDYQLWLKTARNLNFKHLDESLWLYRVHDDSSTSEKNADRCAAATIDVLESVYRSNSIDDFYPEIALCSDRQKALYSAHLDFGNDMMRNSFFYLPTFAVREYEAALAVNPGGMEARNNLAVACAIAGDREKARSIFGSLSASEPHNETIDHNISTFLASDPQGNHRPDYRLLAESIGASELKTNVALVEKGAATAPGSTLPAGTSSAALGREQESTSVCKTRKGHTTILIPSVDPGNDLKACLEAIDIHMDEPHDIIVIKNAGAVPKWLKQHVRSGNTIFIDVPASSGYAARCNRGMEKATGEYVLIIGEDTLLLKDSFSRMLHHLGGASNRGMVVPLANHALGTQKIPGAEDLSVDEFSEYAADLGKRSLFRRAETFETGSFCTLFRRETMEVVGPFNEDIASPFFVINDYRLRLLLKGHTAAVAADAAVFRRHPETRGKGRDRVFHETWDTISPGTEKGKRLWHFVATKNARDHYRKGSLERAMNALSEGMRISPDEPRIYYCAADILMEEKHYRQIVDMTEFWPAAEKLKPPYYELLGYCAYYLERSDEARNLAEGALGLSPDTPGALNLLGLLALRAGDSRGAEGLFRRAIAADPSFGDPHVHLGVMAWQGNDTATGLTLIEKGFILSPEKNDFLATYQSAIESTGNFARAETVIREALGLFPKNRNLAYALIGTLIRQEKYLAALTNIQDAIVEFGIDDEMLGAAIAVRDSLGEDILARHGEDRGTLSVCMIVKNEEKHIARCLKSLVPVADEIVVVDTGSEDRTPRIARVFGAKILQFPWTNDFSEARNYSLDHARGDWILVHDADEVISPRDHDRLRKIVHGKPVRAVAYDIVTRNYVVEPATEGWTANAGEYAEEEAGSGWFPSNKVRLIVNDRRLRFRNPVHELLEPSVAEAGAERLACDIPVHHYGKMPSDTPSVKSDLYYELGKRKLSSSQGNPAAFRELAIQAAELEKFEESIEHWKGFLRLVPDDSIAYFNIASMCMEVGRFEEALQCARRSVELNPNSVTAVQTLIVALIYSGKTKEAVERLGSLLEKSPDYPPAFVALAVAHFIEGSEEKGLGYLERLEGMGYRCGPALHSSLKKIIASGNRAAARQVYGYISKSRHSLPEMERLFDQE